jgi:Enoyl-CoA hydratase/isomerase/Transketolase, thiamine diphosphate binding domain
MSVTLHVSDPGVGRTVRDPRELALRIRLRAVRMVARQGFGYLGQALSSAEQVAAVFASASPGVDRLVCSPGHYVIGPFAAAAELGLLDDDAVSGYGQNGSPVEAIGTERSPVVDYTCGSLGQGLSAALGFALAGRLRGSDARIFTILLGVKRAAYALLTGEAISAQRALEWGMVNEVMPRAQLITRAYQIADHIMTQPRTTRRLTTQIIRRPWKQRIAGDLDGGFGIQMFGHIAKKRAVHGEQHVRSTVDYVREGRKNNFDRAGS